MVTSGRGCLAPPPELTPGWCKRSCAEITTTWRYLRYMTGWGRFGSQHGFKRPLCLCECAPNLLFNECRLHN